MSLSGGVSRHVSAKRTESGSITPSGYVQMLAYESIEGILSFAGSVVRRVFFRRSVSGESDASGTVNKTRLVAFRTLTANLTFVGTLQALGQVVKRGLTMLGKHLCMR